MDKQEFSEGLQEQITAVLKLYGKQDYRERFRWLTGSLGDPFAGIWFVAENPSLTQLERATNPDGGPPTPEAQWYASEGDKLFRRMLVKHGFKSGGVHSLGGWHCYITNAIKEPDYAKHWGAKTTSQRRQALVAWWPVLKWELEQSRPKLIAALGGRTQDYFAYLQQTKSFQFPRIVPLTHYTYIATRPDHRGLNRMDPLRIQEYDDAFAEIAAMLKG